MAVNVGESEIASLEPVGQLRVIEAQQMENRRLDVVDVPRILYRMKGEIVPASNTLAGDC